MFYSRSAAAESVQMAQRAADTKANLYILPDCKGFASMLGVRRRRYFIRTKRWPHDDERLAGLGISLCDCDYTSFHTMQAALLRPSRPASVFT